LAARLKSNNLIQFLGKIDYLEIPSVHQEFDVFVNPSRQESFGVSVLEASSCGKPIIATRVGGLAETVQDGFTGILVSPDNPESLCEALLVLARDKEKRTRMGNNGRAYVLESFDWDKILEKMKSHYLEFGNLESK
jgi:glycosyltransferase involved in cell wall biosynthesis